MSDFSLPPGVSHGTTPSARPNRWYDSNLVRWRDGRLMPVGGWQRITKLDAPLPSICRRILPVRDRAGVERTVLACEQHLLMHDGGSVVDVTPSDFSGIDSGSLPNGFGVGPFGAEAFGTGRAEGSVKFLRASTWSLDSWGEDVMAVCSTDGRLLRWTPTAPSSDATPIAAAPVGARAMVVTPERHVMLIGQLENPRRVQWCQQSDYNNWDFSSVTGNAGWLDLETSGLLYGAAKVTDGTLVFSDSDVWLIRYAAATTGFEYVRQEVGKGISLMSPAAIATFDSGCIWMGRGGFFYYDAGAAKPLPCEISHFIFSDIDPIRGVLLSHASANGLFNEVWFFWPSVGSDHCDRYAIYNYAENWWSLGRMNRSAMCPSDVSKWPLAASHTGHLYQHEDGWTAAGSSRVGNVWVESDAISPGGTWAITRGQMDSGINASATSVIIKGRATRDGTDREYGPFTSRDDGWMPCRGGGQDMRIRISATRDEEWSIGKPLFDMKKVGSR